MFTGQSKFLNTISKYLWCWNIFKFSVNWWCSETKLDLLTYLRDLNVAMRMRRLAPYFNSILLLFHFPLTMWWTEGSHIQILCMSSSVSIWGKWQLLPARQWSGETWDWYSCPAEHRDIDQEQETEERVGSKLKIITGEMDIKQRQ